LFGPYRPAAGPPARPLVRAAPRRFSRPPVRPAAGPPRPPD